MILPKRLIVVYAHIAHKMQISYATGMKIYFTCSTAELNTHWAHYAAIRDYLVSNGHLLTRDWLPRAKTRLLAGDTDVADIKEIYKSCIAALREAELVIIEDTVSNFSTGHQITLALQLRKPTLVLWRGTKHRQFRQMFIHGVESDLLQVAEYDEHTLTDTIQTFINTYDDRPEKNRFHLVLSGIERRYLDWAQFIKHQSRTKVIREALKKTIDSDEEYKKYLLRGGHSVKDKSSAP